MPHLKSIVAALILFSFILSTGVVRADYQNEIGFYTYQTEDDKNNTSDGTGLNYSYYFDNVDTSHGPWAEAGFIDRAANVSLSVSRSDGISGTTNMESSSNFISATISNPDSAFVFLRVTRQEKQTIVTVSPTVPKPAVMVCTLVILSNNIL